MTPPETDPLEQLLGDLPAAKPTASDIEHVRDAIEHCNSTTVETSANGEQPVTQHLWLRRITIPQAIAACLVVCIGSVITTMLLISTPQPHDDASGRNEPPTQRPVAPPVSNGGPQLVIQTDFFTRHQPEPTPRHIGIRQWTTGGGQ